MGPGERGSGDGGPVAGAVAGPAAGAAAAAEGASAVAEPAPDFAAALAALLADPLGSPAPTWKPALPFVREGLRVAAGLLPAPSGPVAAYALQPKPEGAPVRPRGTVLFVHGYLKSAPPFAPLLRHLVEEGYWVVALDLPGHGASYGPRFTVGDFLEYGEAVTAAAGLCGGLPRPLIGMGHSLGGLSLLEAEELRAGGWKGGGGQTEPSAPREPKAAARPLFDALLLVTPLSLSSHWPLIRRVAHLPHREAARMPFSRVPVSWVLGLEAWRDRMDGPASPAGPEAHIAVTVPAGVILGARDRVIDLSDARSLYARLLPEARFYDLPWMGHWEIEEGRPDERLLRLIDGELLRLGGEEQAPGAGGASSPG